MQLGCTLCMCAARQCILAAQRCIKVWNGTRSLLTTDSSHQLAGDVGRSQNWLSPLALEPSEQCSLSCRTTSSGLGCHTHLPAPAAWLPAMRNPGAHALLQPSLLPAGPGRSSSAAAATTKQALLQAGLSVQQLQVGCCGQTQFVCSSFGLDFDRLMWPDAAVCAQASAWTSSPRRPLQLSHKGEWLTPSLLSIASP